MLTKAVFITVVVDAYEEHDIACFNIPGAFLHADSYQDITMILKGRLAELMVQVAPNLYRKYILVDRKGMAILRVKMQKAPMGFSGVPYFSTRSLLPTWRASGSS